MAAKGIETLQYPMDYAEAMRLVEILYNKKEWQKCMYVLIAITTGFRMKDILHITWEKFNRFNNSVTIKESKTGKVRTVRIDKNAWSILKECKANIGFPNTEYLFKSPAKEKPMTSSWVNKFLKITIRKNNIKSKTTASHTLRKTFVLRIYLRAKQDGDIDAILRLIDILGHDELSTLLRYLCIPNTTLDKYTDNMFTLNIAA